MGGILHFSRDFQCFLCFDATALDQKETHYWTDCNSPLSTALQRRLWKAQNVLAMITKAPIHLDSQQTTKMDFEFYTCTFIKGRSGRTEREILQLRPKVGAHKTPSPNPWWLWSISPRLENNHGLEISNKKSGAQVLLLRWPLQWVSIVCADVVW